MEQYKEKLKFTQRVISIAALILAIFTVLGFVSEEGLINLTPVTGDSHWQSMWRGIVSGASCGIAALMLVGLIRISNALKDETALKNCISKITTSVRSRSGPPPVLPLCKSF